MDLPSIVRIYNQSIPERNATCDMEPARLEDRISWFHAHDTSYPLWVAEVEGQIAGWACISAYSDRLGYRYSVENSVYVEHSHRSRGLGTLMLAKTVEETSALGYHAIIARVFSHNPASVALHRRFGFEEMGCLREIASMDGIFRDVLFLVKLLNNEAL
jgi:phosphinothricin acetyltransferase